MSRNNRDIMSRVTSCLQCWQAPPHNKWTQLLAIFCPVHCSPRLANTSNQHPAVITITKYFLCVRNIFFVLRLNIFQSGWRGTAPSNDTFAGLYAGFWSGLNNNKQLAGGGYDCAGIISCSYGRMIVVSSDANDPSVSQLVFTITEKAPTRAFSWLQAPTL